MLGDLGDWRSCWGCLFYYVVTYGRCDEGMMRSVTQNYCKLVLRYLGLRYYFKLRSFIYSKLRSSAFSSTYIPIFDDADFCPFSPSLRYVSKP